MRVFFHRCLRLATAERPLLLLIDGLDRLRAGSAGLQNLQWLHLECDLPAFVRLVVGTQPAVEDRHAKHDLLASCRAILPNPDQYLEIGPLSNEVLNASAACVLHKDIWGRTLTNEQSRAVVWAFDQSPSPLMLRLLLAAAAPWTSTTPFGEGPALLQALASDQGVAGIVNHLFDQWEETHGRSVIARLLTTLAVSPAGLTPTEALDILSRDPDARRDLALADVRPEGGACNLVWTLLYADMRVVLAPRACALDGVGQAGLDHHGSGLVAFVFAHAAVREVVLTRYGLKDEATWQAAHAFMAVYHGASDEHHVPRHISGNAGGLGNGTTGTNAATGGLTAAGVASAHLAGCVLGTTALYDTRADAAASCGSRFLARCGPSAAALLKPGAWLGARLRRTLQLLAHHQLQAGNLPRAEACLSDLSYVVLAVHAGMGAGLLANMQMASVGGGVVPARLASMTSFAAEGVARLQGHTNFNLLQQALCFPHDEGVRTQAKALVALLPPLLRRAVLRPNLPPPPSRTSLVLGGGHSPILKCVRAGAGLLLAMREDRTVAIVDLTLARSVATLPAAKTPLVAVAASGDGTRAITATRDGHLRAWQLPAAKSEAKASVHAFNGEVAQLCVCHDGQLVALRYSGGNLAIWDLSTGGYAELEEGGEMETGGLRNARSSSRRRRSSSSQQRRGNARISQPRNSIVPLQAHEDLVTDCAFAPSGHTLASSSRDETVILWNARAGKVMRRLEGHTASVETCRFHPSGAFVITGSEDTTVRIWEVRSGRTLQVLEGHMGTPELCAFAPDFACTKAVSAARNGVLQLWQIHGYGSTPGAVQSDSATSERAEPRHRELFFFAGTTRYVLDCAFSPDGRLIVANSDSGMFQGRTEGS